MNKEDIIMMFVKTFFINMYIFQTNLKIYSKKQDLKTIFIMTNASILGAIIYIIIDKQIERTLLIFILFFIQIGYLKLMVREEKSVLVMNLISNAIVYISFVVSLFVVAIPRYIIYITDNMINLLVTLAVQEIIIINFFRIKRFTNGLSFLKNKSNNDYIEFIMINVSVIILFIYCLFKTYNGEEIKYIIVPFFIVGAIMILMIQKTLTLYYKQKMLVKAVEDYKKEIEEKDKKIESISKEKYEISKLNHEFYHRQKALELKVSNMEAGNEISVKEQIEKLSSEYTKKLENIKEADKLPITEIEEIDDMFKYMQSECEKYNIKFDLKIENDIHHLVNKIISQEKLVTLIGDFLRNAINSINFGNSPNKSVLAILGIKDGCYEFCVFDSGIEFEIKTLEKLGTEPATTHKENGGTGIGFMTTFETMEQTKASLIIEEKSKPSATDYTKSITIRFDDLHEYRIKSYRAKELREKIKSDRIKIL